MVWWLPALDKTLAASLPGFLPQQRWFAGKARDLATVGVDDLVALPAHAEGPHCALVVVRATYADGGTERYIMLVAALAEPGDAAVIAAAGAWPGPGALVEASTLETCTRGLLSGFAAGPGAARFPAPTTRAGGRLEYGDLATPGPFAGRPIDARRVRPLGAEQSNTSLLVDREHVFKLFRRLEPGENPEVEIGRFLAQRTQFRAMPMLHGSLSLDRDGVRHTVGVLQSFVVNDGDGWRWTLARLADPAGVPADAIRSLGETTADFHIALGAGAGVPGFAPVPLTAAQCLAWTEDVRRRLARSLGLVRHTQPVRPAALYALAARVLAGQAALERRATAPDPAAGGFDLIRIHGDFHLGQTLRVEHGFMLMDFEGEPARTLDERRAPAAALRDVAGMLRSFDYAVVAAGLEDPGAAAPLREAYLAGYDARAAHAPFLPSGAAARAAWIAFFELEKALYELEYEINNRPDWLRIPLQGILRVLGQGV